jgi:hypothetical protein
VLQSAKNDLKNSTSEFKKSKKHVLKQYTVIVRSRYTSKVGLIKRRKQGLKNPTFQSNYALPTELHVRGQVGSGM